MSDPDPAAAVDGLELTGVEEESSTGNAVDEATESHQAAEGTSTASSLNSRDGLKNALLRTEPNRSLDQVESPYDPGRGGETRIYRGLQKMLDFEGMPAILDIVVGLLEFAQNFEVDGGNREQSADELPEGIEGDVP
jgi:hypothetical protein